MVKVFQCILHIISYTTKKLDIGLTTVCQTGNLPLTTVCLTEVLTLKTVCRTEVLPFARTWHEGGHELRTVDTKEVKITGLL